MKLDFLIKNHFSFFYLSFNLIILLTVRVKNLFLKILGEHFLAIHPGIAPTLHRYKMFCVPTRPFQERKA